MECGGYPSITIIQYDGTKEAKDGLGSRDASEELSGLVPDRAPHGTSQVHSVMLHRRGWITIPEDDILTSYTFSHLLKGQDQDPIVNGIGNNLTKICFLALSTTFFGAEHKETSLVQRGLHRYCFALKELQKALGDQRRHDSVDLPHAVVVMALFEVSPPSSCFSNASSFTLPLSICVNCVKF